MATATKTWAILGGGNGGQALAGHLSIMGHNTRLYDIIPATVEAVNAQKGVTLTGAVEGFGSVEFATMDIAKALDGADYVMVTVTSLAHATLARQCAPLLKDGQHVFVHPGASLGALEFYRIIRNEGCKADIIVSETNSLIYSARSLKPGSSHIYGIKSDLQMGCIPSDRTKEAEAIIQTCFKQIRGVHNIIESSLTNSNAVMHPAASLLSTSYIESGKTWYYYKDAFTPTTGKFTENLDKERLAIAKAYGLELESILQWYKTAYGVDAKTVDEAANINPKYEGIEGPNTIMTRFIREDVPHSLVPMVALARLKGIKTPYMDVVIELGYLLLGRENFPPARDMASFGFEGITAAEFERYVKEGK